MASHQYLQLEGCIVLIFLSYSAAEQQSANRMSKIGFVLGVLGIVLGSIGLVVYLHFFSCAAILSLLSILFVCSIKSTLYPT